MPSAASSGFGRARVVPGQPPHGPQLVEGVSLTEPVAEVAVDAQRLLQQPGSRPDSRRSVTARSPGG